MSTPNMGLTLPIDHASNDVWATILSSVFDAVDSHNHTTGRGVKVPTGGLDIDADLSFSPSGTPRAILDLKAIDFVPVASSTVTALVGAFFISDGTGGLTANELYYRTILGSNVQVTLGAALNVAAFSGGIGGDYIPASALLSYDAASLSYWHQQPGAPRPWARMRSGDIDIYETAASIVNRVRLKSPAALGASYDVTWPAAVPGSTQLMQMSAAGVLSASSTVANAVTLSGGITNNVTLTGGATASALITANAGVTAGANQSFTVSGTGRYKHPSEELGIHIAAFRADGASAYVPFNQIGYITGFTGACTVQAWIPLPVGKRILTYRQFYNVNGTGASITPKLRRMTIGTGVVNDVAVGAADSTGAVVESQNLTGINHTVLASEGYFIQVDVSQPTHQVFGASISYDDP